MKKLYLFLLSMVVILTACNDDDKTDFYKVVPVSVQLQYPSGSEVSEMENVTVTVTSASGVEYINQTMQMLLL